MEEYLKMPRKVSIAFKQGTSLPPGFYTLIDKKDGFVALLTEDNNVYEVSNDLIAYMKNTEVPPKEKEPEMESDYEGVIGLKTKKRR